MHCKIWQEIIQSNVLLQHPDEDFNTKATVVLRPNKVKWEVKHHHCWVFSPPSLLQSTGSSSWSTFSGHWLINLQPHPHESPPIQILACQQAGVRQTWPSCIVSLFTHQEIHLWKGLRTFFRLLGGLPLSAHGSLDSGRWPPGMKKPVCPGGGENGGTPAPGGWWWGGPEGKKPPLAAMSLGGPPLKMRLKKSCKSAGLVGPVACSEGDLKEKSWKVHRSSVLEPYSDFFLWAQQVKLTIKILGKRW